MVTIPPQPSSGIFLFCLVISSSTLLYNQSPNAEREEVLNKLFVIVRHQCTDELAGTIAQYEDLDGDLNTPLDNYKSTLLHVAVCDGWANEHVIRLLLKKGAQINACSLDGDGSLGGTALDMVERYMERGTRYSKAREILLQHSAVHARELSKF